jgi:GH18 family chitinase
MSWRTLRIFLLSSLLAGAAPAHGAERRVVAYVPTWVDLKAFAETIEYDKLTHIAVAFANPANDAGDLSFKDDVAALVARARAHRVKVLASIGGGGASGNKAMLARYGALLADARRPAFVARLADYVAKHDFDGLDVDLEGPSIGKDYGAFVADLDRALRPRGRLLTAALSKGYGGERVPDAALRHFDFVNLMAYDAKGPWSPDSPGQHSSMELAKDSVRYWVGRGLPKDKAVLGVPFYGYGFGRAYRKRDYPYSLIVAIFPGAENADQAGDTVYYNGLPTVRAKAKYVIDEGLGGVMIWSLDYDVTGSKSLLGAIHETLAPPDRSPPDRKRPTP